jgi:hypothetical protein
MKDYRCRRCEYSFCSDDIMPYCPACVSESLEEIDELDIIELNINEPIQIELEEHHIHPRFMDNRNGSGKKYKISKKQHSILHGKIMNWIWQEIPIGSRDKIIKNIITKSKKEIGV